MQTIEHTAHILGCPPDVKTYHDLDEKVRSKLPKSSLDRVIGDIFLHRKEEATRFSRTILPRGSATQPKLTEHQSERIARLARVYARAIEVFGGYKDDAREFMLKPHFELYDRRPIDVACTDLGAVEVEDILGGIAYGIPV